MKNQKDSGGKLPVSRAFMMPECGALATVIRERREMLGLSLNQLSSLTQISRPMIRFIETKERIPTIDTVARISRAFGVRCSKLLAEAEERLKL